MQRVSLTKPLRKCWCRRYGSGAAPAASSLLGARWLSPCRRGGVLGGQRMDQQVHTLTTASARLNITNTCVKRDAGTGGAGTGRQRQRAPCPERAGGDRARRGGALGGHHQNIRQAFAGGGATPHLSSRCVSELGTAAYRVDSMCGRSRSCRLWSVRHSTALQHILQALARRRFEVYREDIGEAVAVGGEAPCSQHVFKCDPRGAEKVAVQCMV